MLATSRKEVQGLALGLERIGGVALQRWHCVAAKKIEDLGKSQVHDWSRILASNIFRADTNLTITEVQPICLLLQTQTPEP